MTDNSGRLVCLCKHVTAREIQKVLRAGARTTSEIQYLTAAGTGCTRCILEIDAIVRHHQTRSKKDPQFRIEFE